VRWGRAWEEEGAPAFWPWVQVLRSWIADRDADQLRRLVGVDGAVLGHLVPEITERLPGLSPPAPLDAAQARFRLFDAVSRLLTRATLERPLMVVLDDLHWADTPSLLLLQFLARELAGARLLVVGTYREAEAARDQAVSRTLAELTREPSTQRLALVGLTVDEVTRLVALEGGAAPSGALASRLHERTGGNPFFVGELVRLLARDGEVVRSGPSDDIATRIPEAVRDVVARRLATLGERVGTVLELASVIGREFSLPVLERVADLPRDTLLDALDEAIDFGLIAADAERFDCYCFAHALTRDALYLQLSRRRLARVHQQVGEALEVVHAAALGPHLAELAHHFSRARREPGDRRAVVYATRAGQRALDLLAYEEAARLFAVALGQEAHESERCELLLALADAQLRAGQAVEARETFAQASAGARLLADPELLARAAVGLGEATRFAWNSEPAADRLIGLLDESLRALGERSPTLRASVLSQLATALFWRSWTDTQTQHRLGERVRALSGDAVVAARSAEDPAALASALDARYYAIWTPESLAERIELADELVALAEARGDEGIAQRGRKWRIVNAAEGGDGSALDDEIAAYMQVAERSRRPMHLLWSTLWQAARALMQGRFASAEALHAQAQTIATGLTTESVQLQHALLIHRWLLARERGQLALVERPIADVVARHPGLAAWRTALAHTYAATGRTVDARRELAVLGDSGFAQLPRDGVWLVTTTALADACVLLGDAARAREVYELLLPFRDRCSVVSVALACTGAVSLHLGRLAELLGDRDAASVHFEAALAINARLGARPYTAHSQHEYARLLHMRARPGDAERAAELARQAAATAQELGMTDLATRVRDSGLVDATDDQTRPHVMSRIAIDEARKEHAVSALTHSAYFLELRSRARGMRSAHGPGDPPSASWPARRVD
jgi:hypothetical protein